MKINVSIYGPLARRVGGRHIKQFDIDMPPRTSVSRLMGELGLPETDRGYLFINSVLCEVPGISTGSGEILRDGDHVGIFSKEYVWPYQYRDGIPMSESLKELLRTHGSLHHSYKVAVSDDET